MTSEIVKINDKHIATVNIKDAKIDLKFKSEDDIISYLSSDITDSDIGYAGFRDKQGLTDYLKKVVLNDKTDWRNVPEMIIDRKSALETIKLAMVKCASILPDEHVNIFVFPTWNDFVRIRMDGSTGYTPWHQAVLIFINPSVSNWRDSMIKTVAHEYNHSVFLRDNQCKTVMDIVIMEGLAEHFRKRAVGGSRAPWTTVIDIEQSKALYKLLDMKNIMSSIDKKVIHSLFFGGEEFDMWTGYSLGYHITESFLRRNPDVHWPDIMKRSPRDILSGSDFIN